MALEIDGLVREERVRSPGESQETLIDLLGVDVGGIASEQEAEPDETDVPQQEPDEVVAPQGAAAGNPKAAGAAAAAQREPGFSRALIDTYFRQMGHGDLLTREQEIALAQRIEAAQAGVLKSLCRLPMVLTRIDGWGRELRNGALKLGDLID